MAVGSYDNFAFGFAEGHIPRRGEGLGVGQVWNCLRSRQVSQGSLAEEGFTIPYYINKEKPSHLAWFLFVYMGLLSYDNKISIILIAAVATGVPGPKMAAAPSR